MPGSDSIVPDMTHYEPFAPARVADLAIPFLDGRMTGAPKSAVG